MWWELVAVAGTVLAGGVLRFATTSALWLDEAQSVTVSALPFGEITGALGRDGLPPVYYWLLHAWISLFGEGDVAVRSLSGVLAVLSLPLIYLAGRQLAGPVAGFAALVLLAVNPFAIRYATEARMYSLIVLLVLTGFLLVEASVRLPKPWRLVGVALVAGLLMLTHYWTFWLVGAAALVLARRWLRGPAEGRSGALRTLLAVGAGGLFFLPWLPTFLDQSAHTATPWAQASRPTSVAAIIIEGFGGPEVAEAKLLGFVLAVLVLLGIFGRAVSKTQLVLDLRTRKRICPLASVMVLTIALGVGVSLVTDSAFALRYAAVILPLYLLLGAVGVSRLLGRTARALLMGLVVALGLAVALHNTTAQRTQAQDIVPAIEEGAAAEIEAGGMPLVLYCPDQLGPAVHRLLPDGYDQVIYPDLEPESVGSVGRVDWYDYAERHAASDPTAVADAVLDRAGPDTTIWVVSSTDYRIVDERCDELLTALGAARGGLLIVAENGDDYFEHGALHVYPPATP